MSGAGFRNDKGAADFSDSDVRSRMEQLLTGESVAAPAREFSVRELVFLAGCARYGGAVLTVRHAARLEDDQWASLSELGDRWVSFAFD